MARGIVPADTAHIDLAARALQSGELVAFPTETVYGLGGDAGSDRAVARIYEAKGRPSFNPLIVHVADLDDAGTYAELPPAAFVLAARFWPGPLTLVLPRRKDCRLSLLLSAGMDSVALRAPAHPVARALLAASGLPLAGPSANPSGRISPTTAAHVADGLGDKVAMILDGGPCRIGLESTVLSLLDEVPQIFGPTLIMPGESFKLLFDLASDYQFECTAHASGQMTVIVDAEPTPGWPRFHWRVKKLFR